MPKIIFTDVLTRNVPNNLLFHSPSQQQTKNTAEVESNVPNCEGMAQAWEVSNVMVSFPIPWATVWPPPFPLFFVSAWTREGISPFQLPYVRSSNSAGQWIGRVVLESQIKEMHFKSTCIRIDKNFKNNVLPCTVIFISYLLNFNANLPWRVRTLWLHIFSS